MSGLKINIFGKFLPASAIVAAAIISLALPVAPVRAAFSADMTISGVKYRVVRKNKHELYICPDYSRYYSNYKGEGWFYGQSCRKIKIVKSKKRKLPKKYPMTNKQFQKEYLPAVKNLMNYEFLNNLTAKEFKIFYHRQTEVAVMRPTEQNVGAYLTMTNFMRKKAVAFTYATMVYILNHPSLDFEKKTGETSFSYDAYIQNLHSRQKDFIKNNSARLGIFYFLTNKGLGPKQNHVINWLKRDYGISVIGIAKNFCPSGLNFKCIVSRKIFKGFHVTYEPTSILIYRGPNNHPHYQTVEAGLTDENTIAFRIYKFVDGYKQVNYNINPFQKEGRTGS